MLILEEPLFVVLSTAVAGISVLMGPHIPAAYAFTLCLLHITYTIFSVAAFQGELELLQLLLLLLLTPILVVFPTLASALLPLLYIGLFGFANYRQWVA